MGDAIEPYNRAIDDIQRRVFAAFGMSDALKLRDLRGTGLEPFAEALAQRGFLLLDGGLATELEARGKDLSGELWSARLLAGDPGAILAVHAGYRAAGAAILTTATYQATVGGFRKLGLSASAARDLFGLAVRLARRAAGSGAYVAASVGPFGASLADGSEYRGDYALDEEGLLRWHEERLPALLEAGPDVLAMRLRVLHRLAISACLGVRIHRSLSSVQQGRFRSARRLAKRRKVTSGPPVRIGS